MHGVGFEKAQLLSDKEYVAQQPYSMLWREAVFRGIRPVANWELLHARMFPESENGLSLLRTKIAGSLQWARRGAARSRGLEAQEGGQG